MKHGPRILVCGANGLLGHSLADMASSCPEQASYLFASRQELDIRDAAAIDACLAKTRPDCLINAAAYTQVDRAKQEYGLAQAINADAPGLLARACASRNIRFLHISSDHVFDGRSPHPRIESDPPCPVNHYGRSKLLGEKRVMEHCPSALIVRTSWLFSARRPDFVCAMLQQADTNSLIRVVNDQYGGPTWAGHLAMALHALAIHASSPPGGIYHFAGRPWVSRHEFALEIFRQAVASGRLAKMPGLLPISTARWPTQEPRPAMVRLAGNKLENIVGTLENDWRKGLASAMHSL